MLLVISLNFFKKFRIKTFVFYFKEEAAGFTQEWSANLNDRVARRQIEVQSTQNGNGRLSNEYRTVTAPDQPQPELPEERK